MLSVSVSCVGLYASSLYVHVAVVALRLQHVTSYVSRRTMPNSLRQGLLGACYALALIVASNLCVHHILLCGLTCTPYKLFFGPRVCAYATYCVVLLVHVPALLWEVVLLLPFCYCSIAAQLFASLDPSLLVAQIATWTYFPRLLAPILMSFDFGGPCRAP